jgi:amino acid adenylation domain-containing protein
MDPTPSPIDLLPLLGAHGAPAIVDRDGALSFGEMEAAVARIAGGLRAAGIAPGGRVATWLPKNRTACLMPLAAARAGLVHVPVNPALKRAQVAHILGDSGTALLVTQAARAATLLAGDVPEGCEVATQEPAGEGVPAGGGDPAGLAAILYTSGSTGRPKGVMLSHANLWLGAVSVARYLKLTPADRVLGVLPLSFDYGQNQLFSTWYAGAAVAPIDYLTARDVVKAVDRFAITTLAGVPPLWTQLLETAWPEAVAGRLRRLTNSGGALTPRMIGRLRTQFPEADVYAMYGLTEAFRSTFLDPALIDAHPDAIGTAIPFAEVAVVRPDGTQASQGEAGELVHAGPLVAQGYWRDPERTAQRFRPAPSWMNFGGMAVWSGDTVMRGEDGLLRFVGRDDEMMKVAGNRISPTEVEEAVLAGGEVAEAVAIGVADDRTGQAITVVARAARPEGAAEAETLVRARLRQELPMFQQPTRYVWVEAIPRGPNGKLDRVAARALAR